MAAITVPAAATAAAANGRETGRCYKACAASAAGSGSSGQYALAVGFCAGLVLINAFRPAAAAAAGNDQGQCCRRLTYEAPPAAAAACKARVSSGSTHTDLQ